MSQYLQKIKIYGIINSLKYLLNEVKRKLFYENIRKSYSQSGEDLVVDKLLNFPKTGFYVDIGAYDPNVFSNTKRFYIRGWRGINIEPNPKKISLFNKMRKNDINLSMGVSNKKEQLKYFQMMPESLSTFSESYMTSAVKQAYKVEKESLIQVELLKDILTKYANNVEIDFLSVDVEGRELQVLQGNDWNIFRPKVISIENYTHSKRVGDSTENVEINDFLAKKDYSKVWSNGTNSVFVDNRSTIASK